MLPKALVAPFSPSLRRLFALVDEGLASLKAHRSAIKGKSDGPVIFDSLRHLPDEAAGMEAVDFLVAGSDTTAITLVFAVWHICHAPAIKRKLVAALREAVPQQQQREDNYTYPTLLDLESIPYLVACVKESLRIAMPVPGRLPRVVPNASDSVAEPLVVDDKVVPPGTVVGMSAYTMHNSEELWGANARQFEPERWLGEGAKGLDENLVTFSKGARNCVGQTLAQAELLLVIFILFRNFEVELDGVSEDGVVTRDMFTQSVQEPGLVLKMRRVI
jgi:cytochrome P450